MAILIKDNEKLAREAWAKLFNRNTELGKENQILAVIPAVSTRRQVQISRARPTQRKIRRGWLYREMKGRSR